MLNLEQNRTIPPRQAPQPPAVLEPANTISVLPSELLTEIFHHSSFADVRALRAVNRGFRKAASHAGLLQQKLEQAALDVPGPSGGAASPWMRGLRHLHIQKNLAGGRFTLAKLPEADAAQFHPPKPPPEMQTQLDERGLQPHHNFTAGASHDGSLYAYTPTGVYPETVHLVDVVHSERAEQVFDCDIRGLARPAFSYDLQHLAATRELSEAVVWNLRDGSETSVLCCHKHKEVQSLALSSDGGKLAALMFSHGWRHEVRTSVTVGEGEERTLAAIKRTLRRKDSTVRVFDLTVSPPVQILETWLKLGLFKVTAKLAFSPDNGRLLCETGHGKKARVWDFEAPGLPTSKSKRNR